MPQEKEEEKLPRLYKRNWLNEDEGSGYYIISANHYKKHNRDNGFGLSADIEIKDCNRQITLDFDAYNPKGYEQRLKKLDDFIEGLNELKAFMLANPPQEGTKKEREETQSVIDMLDDEDS